jgi:hypothetical protein
MDFVWQRPHRTWTRRDFADVFGVLYSFPKSTHNIHDSERTIHERACLSLTHDGGKNPSEVYAPKLLQDGNYAGTDSDDRHFVDRR